MKRSRFTEAQIIGILREQEVGMKTTDVYRKHALSEATFYIYGLLPRRKKFLSLV
jgi:putative transposase